MSRARGAVLTAGVLAAGFASAASAQRPSFADGSADLVSMVQDANGFPVNPYWAFQVLEPGSLFDIRTACDFRRPEHPGSVAEYFRRPKCTTQMQQLTIDTAGKGLYAFFCRVVAGSNRLFPGHLNWFPVTVHGVGSFDHVDEGDRDANLLLVPDPAGNISSPGITSYRLPSGKPPAYKLEFDSLEVFDAITWSGGVTPIWKEILSRPVRRRALLLRKRYIAIGLYGLDAEHDYHAELHPVWGLAVRVREEPAVDTWILFARNSGNEGGCSLRGQHPLPLQPSGPAALAFDLPLRTASLSRFEGLFRNIFGEDVRVDTATVTGSDGRRWLRVAIPLPVPGRGGVQLIHGELRISP